MDESEFRKLVASWLLESFQHVDSEVTLPESQHRVDFVAYTPFTGYVIEVEDGWESIYNGLGQSLLYAAETGYEPVVVLPADDVDMGDLRLYQSNAPDGAPIIETV